MDNTRKECPICDYSRLHHKELALEDEPYEIKEDELTSNLKIVCKKCGVTMKTRLISREVVFGHRHARVLKHPCVLNL